MKIFVTAKPRAHEARIEVVDPTHLIVSVIEPPVAGKANAAIARAIAEHFRVSQSEVRLVQGFTSRQKIFEISTST